MSFHRPSRPTARQKKELSALGYDPNDYLIFAEFPNSYAIKNKKTGNTVIVDRAERR